MAYGIWSEYAYATLKFFRVFWGMWISALPSEQTSSETFTKLPPRSLFLSLGV